ncbi:MAG: hypothetical protein ACRD44_05635, partial [Bryobacteraceae bacterium]
IVVSRSRQLNEEVYMIAEFFFESVEDVEEALRSEARREAARDRLKFPKFYGTIRHQILEIKEYPLHS